MTNPKPTIIEQLADGRSFKMLAMVTRDDPRPADLVGTGITVTGDGHFEAGHIDGQDGPIFVWSPTGEADLNKAHVVDMNGGARAFLVWSALSDEGWPVVLTVVDQHNSKAHKADDLLREFMGIHRISDPGVRADLLHVLAGRVEKYLGGK